MASTDLPHDNPDDENEDGVSTRPFVEQPAYGHGLWRSPINFIPAARALPEVPAAPSPDPNSVAARYLAIVFPSGQPKLESDAYPLCGVCGAPVKEDQRAHMMTPVHQSAVPRAPVPSSIDRTRMGLKYLKKHGFDVDSRMGLGVNGQGMLFPIVPKEKRNKHGLGVQIQKGTVEKQAMVRLDAGKVRKMVESDKKKHERLQRMFYADEKVDKYLGDLGY
ncbi:hypothetical protein K504DRAFT_118409 [Pleomassaria siparia CBS 279.74]|uniref:G-patch domain-containing protein n=1 Tax=Pleomassaria siparia CBS 279.74 TaxID=1314801 RepID=A0A6G1JWC7_9PLEO|nr:hypothetical protein K504DRAFT_118409 [Pleomassaria siparia CBS 279.74]